MTDFPLTEKEIREGVVVGNPGGGYAKIETQTKETLEAKMARLADKADEIIRQQRQQGRSFIELVPRGMREAVRQIVEGNKEELLNEYRGKDIVFIEAQMARRMATRLKAVELLAEEDGYQSVDDVQISNRLAVAFRHGTKADYKPGVYMAVTTKGSIVMVDTGSFTEKGGKVVYKRLPMRETKSGVRDINVRLMAPAVKPDTLRVGESFNFGVTTTSGIELMYFKAGATLDDDSQAAEIEKLYGAVDTRLAAVLFTT